MPMIDPHAGRLLREIGLRALLGLVMMAVGTAATVACPVDAAGLLDTPAHATR